MTTQCEYRFFCWIAECPESKEDCLQYLDYTVQVKKNENDERVRKLEEHNEGLKKKLGESGFK